MERRQQQGQAKLARLPPSLRVGAACGGELVTYREHGGHTRFRAGAAAAL